MNYSRTFNEWKAKGFHVKRGQKATGRNAAGVATFTKAQVERNIEYDYEEEDIWSEEMSFADQWRGH